MGAQQRHEKLKDSQAIEVYMLSKTKDTGGGVGRVWGFKGKEENSQEDGKSKYLVTKAMPYRDNGTHTGIWTNKPCQASPSLPHLAHTLCSHLWL